MRVLVIDPNLFECGVFGGRCFLDYYPNITTTGVEVIHTDDSFYVTLDGERPVNDTAFFTHAELAGDRGCKLIED